MISYYPKDNGHLYQAQLKALPNVVADQLQQHYDFNNNSNNRYW
jgi:hypothetical protein